MTIIAAADGSALGNPGPAGWAWFIDETSWRAGGWDHGTNNMGELTAVLNLLESTRHRADEPLKILCDSQYVINSVTKWLPGWKKKGWKKSDGKPVLNVDIMQALDRELAGRAVEFEWVKGHAGHPLNEAADERARAMATAFQAKRSPGQLPAGPGFRDASQPTRPASEPLTGAESGMSLSTGAGTDAHIRSAWAPKAETSHEEPDLFSELQASEREQEKGPDTAGADPVRQFMERESALWNGPTSGSIELLHEQFEYVSADGGLLGAERFLGDRERDRDARATPELEAASAVSMGPTAYHLTYRMLEAFGITRRSSLWLREDHYNEMGPWLLRFHQVTPES